MKIFAISSFQSKSNNKNISKPNQAQTGLRANTNLSLMAHYNVSFASQSRRVMLPEPIKPLTEKEALQQGYTLVYDKEGLKEALNGDKKTILMSDIDFGNAITTKFGLGNWESIYSFSNELNGNGYKLKNFKNGLNYRYSCDKGIFCSLYNAVVKNLKIENAYLISNDDSASSKGFGILANESYGSKIENCAVSGKLLTKNEYTGGVIGNPAATNFDNIRVNIGIETIPSAYNVPYTKKTLPIDHPSVPHTYQSVNGIGALAGNMEDCKVTNCCVNCQINGWEFVGGIAGIASNTKIQNCRTEADLSGTAFVGGIIGTSAGSEFENIEGAVKVRARIPEKSHLIGGFIGLLEDRISGSDDTIIKNCNLIGSVSKSNTKIDKASCYKDREDNRLSGGYEEDSELYVENCDISNVKIV